MKDDATQPDHDAIERALSKRFAHLRADEQRYLPAFPTVPAQAMRISTPLPRGTKAPAAAAALAASVLLAVLAIPQTQSPDALYREVMNANTLLGEGVTGVSAGLLPAMHQLPDLLSASDYLDASPGSERFE